MHIHTYVYIYIYIQPLRVVLVHLKRHISGSCSGLHSLVILQAGLDPVVVQLLGWLVQDELEVDPCASVVTHQLNETRCTTSLTPEALAGLAGPSSTGHSRLFHLHFPWTDTAEDETAICSAPKRVNVLVAKVVLLVLGAAYERTLAVESSGYLSVPEAKQPAEHPPPMRPA